MPPPYPGLLVATAVFFVGASLATLGVVTSSSQVALGGSLVAAGIAVAVGACVYTARLARAPAEDDAPPDGS